MITRLRTTVEVDIEEWRWSLSRVRRPQFHDIREHSQGVELRVPTNPSVSRAVSLTTCPLVSAYPRMITSNLAWVGCN